MYHGQKIDCVPTELRLWSQTVRCTGSIFECHGLDLLLSSITSFHSIPPKACKPASLGLGIVSAWSVSKDWLCTHTRHPHWPSIHESLRDLSGHIMSTRWMTLTHIPSFDHGTWTRQSKGSVHHFQRPPHCLGNVLFFSASLICIPIFPDTSTAAGWQSKPVATTHAVFRCFRL
jgi:hypothetical protein